MLTKPEDVSWAIKRPCPVCKAPIGGACGVTFSGSTFVHRERLDGVLSPGCGCVATFAILWLASLTPVAFFTWWVCR